jgi:ubiquinone/menaquinone biosynthesis C-methylase UbiE
MTITESERRTQEVYGETFARYDTEEFLSFLRPLEMRLAANGISQNVFRNRKCLDGGCGGGRATVLMARAGAARVTALDLAAKNIETTSRMVERLGLKSVETRQGSLLELPFEDESFDVVWSNGVIHHTVDPDRALVELARVLKPGGDLWLYVYGSGGLYWFMIDFLRARLSGILMRDAMAYLTLAEVPTGRIAELMDDWYVPVLKRYVHQDLSQRLESLGFAAAEPLAGGVSYDTSVRTRIPEQRPYMGEGDLRYWVRKVSHREGGAAAPLPDVDGKGSAIEESLEVLAFATLFEEFFAAVDRVTPPTPEGNAMASVLAASQLQIALRDLMSTRGRFDPFAFRDWIVSRRDRLRAEAR